MQLTLKDISHAYTKGNQVLQSINISLKPGITGLLGVNGAGKSTLLNILATVIQPTDGRYELNGKDVLKKPNEIRSRLGYLPQHFGYIPELSCLEFLSYMGIMKGCDRKALKESIPALLASLNLLDARHKTLQSLSGGMRQRIGIAQALINKPQLLLFDEPTVGLDPNERNNFNQLLADIAKDATILLSSHIIDDIASVCEQVILLDAGCIKYQGTVSALLEEMEGLVYEELIDRKHLEAFKKQNLLTHVKPVGDQLLVRYLSTGGLGGSSVKPALEDAFIFKTKYKGEEAYA